VGLVKLGAVADLKEVEVEPEGEKTRSPKAVLTPPTQGTKLSPPVRPAQLRLAQRLPA